MTNLSKNSDARRLEWPLLATPVLACLLVLPLFLHGPSCGHDFGFHMQSWMEVAHQLRQGTLFPRWAYTPAFNAGEPRFMFYPPVSWLVGGGLLLFLPSGIVPAVFTLQALALAGWAMYALARQFTSPAGALLAMAAYVANPYMLFTAFERTAYAELLAAAWLPWLLRAVLAPEPRLFPIAVPVALLWLTNAPAAVMGTYTLVLVFAVRLVQRWMDARKAGVLFSAWVRSQLSFLGNGGGGLLLGLALAGFYLIPAAFERRYVQIAMAIIPNMRVEDNFLFGHTGYGPHDQVLHTASLVSVILLCLTFMAALAALWRSRASGRNTTERSRREVLPTLLVVGTTIAVLLWHATLPFWRVVPEMMFLQFPWRLLAVLGCVFGACLALALDGTRIRPAASVLLAVVVVMTCGFLAMPPFRQGCEAHELPPDRVALFNAHHGVGPTDEYTPADADNDQLRWDDPAWWLAATPNAPGPGTVPNPAATILDYDQPPPLNQTVSGQAPTRLELQLQRPENLVLNLRDYPAWVVVVNGHVPPHLERDDGLIALALPAGHSNIEVHWRRLPDVWLGDGVSLLAACVLAWLPFQSRRIRGEQ